MDTNQLAINNVLGDLSDLAFEKIKSTLQAFDLPKPAQAAISDMADSAVMLNMRIVGGPKQVNNENICDHICSIFEGLAILDIACKERINETTPKV